MPITVPDTCVLEALVGKMCRISGSYAGVVTLRVSEYDTVGSKTLKEVTEWCEALSLSLAEG